MPTYCFLTITNFNPKSDINELIIQAPFWRKTLINFANIGEGIIIIIRVKRDEKGKKSHLELLFNWRPGLPKTLGSKREQSSFFTPPMRHF